MLSKDQGLRAEQPQRFAQVSGTFHQRGRICFEGRASAANGLLGSKESNGGNGSWLWGELRAEPSRYSDKDNGYLRHSTQQQHAKGKLRGEGKAEEVGKRKNTTPGKTSNQLERALRSTELEANWERITKQRGLSRKTGNQE